MDAKQTHSRPNRGARARIDTIDTKDMRGFYKTGHHEKYKYVHDNKGKYNHDVRGIYEQKNR